MSTSISFIAKVSIFAQCHFVSFRKMCWSNFHLVNLSQIILSTLSSYKSPFKKPKRISTCRYSESHHATCSLIGEAVPFVPPKTCHGQTLRLPPLNLPLDSPHSVPSTNGLSTGFLYRLCAANPQRLLFLAIH